MELESSGFSRLISDMPSYDGHAIITSKNRIDSATAKRLEALEYDAGVRVIDGYLGKSHKVSNRKVIVTKLVRAIHFTKEYSCFDINTKENLLVICAGRLVYILSLETHTLRAELGKIGAFHKS
jgi:hypothetical protein